MKIVKMLELCMEEFDLNTAVKYLNYHAMASLKQFETETNAIKLKQCF